MKAPKIELLGLSIILLGIALSLNNVFAYIGGALGLGITTLGCFINVDK